MAACRHPLRRALARPPQDEDQQRSAGRGEAKSGLGFRSPRERSDMRDGTCRETRTPHVAALMLATGSAMNYATAFKSVRDAVSPAEWQTRVDLAACYRLMDCYDMTDLIYNHITARIPGTEDHLLINLYGLLYREITASSLVKIDVEGNILQKPDTDYSINKSGYVIHGAIHKARPDVACIIHTHTRAGMVVAAMKCGLLPLSQTSIRFSGHIGYHDYEGPAVDLAERERLVADLGPHDAMVMRNHGLLTCGATIQQAVIAHHHRVVR